MPKIIELTFQGLAYPGQAFGRDDQGRMIFAPFGLPGEMVRVEIEEEHKRWAQAHIIEILTPAPERIPARCRHYTICGGCHYQHMPYALQLQAKQEIVRLQLERLGGLQDPNVEAMVPSPSAWHTRNHVQFHLDENGRLGFFAAASNQVVPIQECYLPDEILSGLWPCVDLDPIPSLERVALRSGRGGSQMIILHGEGVPQLELSIDLSASVVWLTDEGSSILAGEDTLMMEVLHRPFRVSAGSFFQVHAALTEQLVEHVMQTLCPQSGEIILDLYAGVGLFSAFIAQTGGRVIAVEASPWACDDFAVNLDPFTQVELYQATVEDALPALDPHPHSVLVDPPRAGLGKGVIQQLLDLHPDRLVYVSCDPATLARDARLLIEGGYQLNKSTPFDFFPQTYHIETLSLFLR
jgi:23S rRNA (uracil1939-C5)-methyltransferase